MVRTVVEESSKNIIIMDVFSRLVKERILFIDGPIDDELANGIISQLIYLDSISKEDIQMYINSPGGSITSGLAILDTMNLIKSPIKTIGIGVAASMAAIILMNGAVRTCTPNCRIMLHQPSGGSIGTFKEMQISLEEMSTLKDIVYNIIANKTFITDINSSLLFDVWMSPSGAKSLNIIDYVLNAENSN